jgi:hypothetical protein
MVLNCIETIKKFFANSRIILMIAISCTSIEVFGQWGCGEIGLSVNETSGCGIDVEYTFSSAGMQTVGSPSWEIAGAGIPSGGGSLFTVTWTGTPGIRYVKVTYAELQNGNPNPIERCSEKAYQFLGSGGTISGGPASGKVCAGQSATFSYTGGIAGTVTWQRCTTNCSTTSDDGWSTNLDNTFFNLSSTTYVRVKLTATCGDLYSSTKTVNVEAFPTAGFMNFIQGSSNLPSGGGSVQFELTGYSANATYVLWEQSQQGGPWLPLYGNDFLYGQHRSAVHFVSTNTAFRAIAKSSDGCVSESGGYASQLVFISEPPPPPPSPSLSGPTTNVCKEVYHTYTLADAATFQTSWQITGGSYDVLPSDYSSSSIYSIQVKWNSGVEGSVKVSYHSNAHNITDEESLPVSLLTPGSISITGNDIACSGENVTLTAGGGAQYTWSGSGISNTAENPITVSPTVATQYQVTGVEPICNLSKTAIKNIEVRTLPDTPGPATLTNCTWQHPELKIEDEFNGTYDWYGGDGSFLGNGVTWSLPTNHTEGTFQYQAQAVDFYGCRSLGRASISLNITSGNCDDKLNWTEARGFGKDGIIAHSKQYYDYAGSPLQSQTFTFQGTASQPGPKIFLSQAIKDRYDRVVGATLSAPSTLSSFKYEPTFAWSINNRPFNYKDIDDPNDPSTVLNPVPINHQNPGTLGWYYSSNNTWEPLVPKTDYPYSRTDFYNDGSGDIRKLASPGDQHRIGANHEVLKGTFPVFLELNDYLAKRSQVLGITASSTIKSVQSVVRDENGNYAIVFSDESGKAIMSCRSGKNENEGLAIHNIINSSGDPTSANYRPMTYFYILHDQSLDISGSTDFIAENIVTNERKTAGDTFAGDNDGIDDDNDGTVDNEWPAGFYRLILSNKASAITITYDNYFLDVAYEMYDDAGRLRASISPNGFEQWKFESYENIDKTTYTYNHQGWLLSMTEPDAGETQYLYRKDGNIRSSQNAKQQTGGSFSYTNYDYLGRPVQSGEYTGSSYSFASLNAQLEYAGQIDFLAVDPTHTKDWSVTYYDNAPPELPGVPFDQEFIRGDVSSTKNRNMQTWYNYDEFGKIISMVQKPAHLSMHFLTEYTYDFLGNVKVVKTSRHVLKPIAGFQNIFYHHYDYDADQRLIKAYTSTDGSNKKLRAAYEYYLHGPLKRIELGTNIQGVDFVYNIHGWLIQINDPDANEDPGKDGSSGDNANVRPDAFAMELNYYESNLGALYSANATPSLHDLHRLHGLPTPQEEQMLANHQPLIRFNQMEDVVNSVVEPPAFKKYSAENAQYKQMLLNRQTNKK